jgi:hypothetical protein
MAILLNPRIWLALALAAALAFGGVFCYRAGKANVRADFDRYKLEQDAESRKAETEARAKEQELQASADATTKAKDEQILNIHARLDDALVSLRNRPERPAGGVVPEAASTANASTGTRLYRDDSEFLSRLASSAAIVVSERDACYSQYESLRAAAGR